MPQQDHYAVLGVSPEASPAAIKQAYRRLALECHPDRFPDDEDAAQRFRAVSEAYGVLGDPAARARYDRSLRFPDTTALANPMNLPSARELFANVFGDVFGQKRRRRREGRDVRYTLSVDLADAVLGSRHSIEFESFGDCHDCEGSGTRKGGRRAVECELCEGKGEVKGAGLLGRRSRCGRCDGMGMIQLDPCPKCRGRGSLRSRRQFSVKIPPGTEAGAERILRGQGEPGRFGGSPGNLRVTINIRPHATLERHDFDLHCTLPVSITQAALGAAVDVDTVDGPATLNVPAGVQSGTRLRMAGRGVPRKDGQRGDQFVRVLVETPIEVDERLRSLLEQLEDQCSDDQLPRRAQLNTPTSSSK